MMPTALAVIVLCAGPVALSSQVRPFPQPASADSLIRDATAKEAAVRKALDGSGASPSILKAVRTVVGDYEGIVRRHPSSAVGDDALWRAGKLSRDAFESFHDARERSAALRLFQQLTLAYPNSEFAKQAPDQLAWLLAHGATQTAAEHLPRPALDTARPAVDTTEQRTTEPRTALVALRTAPAAPTPALVNTPTASPSQTNLVNVKAIRRTVLADVVRIVIELDGEVAYHDERLDAPNRVFVDLPTTRANLTLQDQTIRFDDDTDIVRLIRVGRHPNNITRVVLEGAGIASYSVYPAYSPYRLVIDCIRTKPAGNSAPLGNYKVAAARPPSGTVVPKPTASAPVIPALLVAAPAIGSPTVVDARPSAAPSPSAATAGATGPVTPGAERPAWATTLKNGTAASASVAPVAPPAPPILRSQKVRWRMPLPSLPVAYLPDVTMVDPVAAVADARPTRSAEIPETPEIPAEVAPAPPARNVAGGLSMARQLGLGVSRIVIDPGHGGHDPGAQSSGVTESELVLDVALRLEKLLSKLPGVDVVMTRRENEFIPLQERTAIANRESADLFLSIHANASNIPAAHGVETYFLNFASNVNAAAVASRENATSGQTMGALPDVVKNITLTSKRDESRDFATYVQREMMTSLKSTNKTLRDLGVKQAPFVVLIGASMPSILAEISFLTNPQDAKLLKNSNYRQRIAQALFDGVRKYQTSLKTAPAVAHQN